MLKEGSLVERSHLLMLFSFFTFSFSSKNNIYLRLSSDVHLSLALNSFKRNASPVLARGVFVAFLFLKI